MKKTPWKKAKLLLSIFLALLLVIQPLAAIPAFAEKTEFSDVGEENLPEIDTPGEDEEEPPLVEEEEEEEALIAPLMGITGATGEAWDGGSAPTPDANGVYQIGTAEELAWFAKQANETPSYSAAAVLTADIDLNGKEWTPIGTQTGANAFKGIFDGAGHTIKGLKIDTSGANKGLFGVINGATIKTLM